MYGRILHWGWVRACPPLLSESQGPAQCIDLCPRLAQRNPTAPPPTPLWSHRESWNWVWHLLRPGWQRCSCPAQRKPLPAVLTFTPSSLHPDSPPPAHWLHACPSRGLYHLPDPIQQDSLSVRGGRGQGQCCSRGCY